MTTLAANKPLETISTKAASAPRLMSVDALRGFDMFWIIGADALVYALNRMSHTRPTEFLANQLEHADWEGFHFYDLIFPLFVFIVGVSLVFSLTKLIQQGGRAEAVKRVVRRGVLLYLVGLFYSGGFTYVWPNMRLSGVLNRIAIAYLFAGLFFCFFKPRALVAICVALLTGYWAIMTFVPIRDIQMERGTLEARAKAAGDDQTAALFKEEGFGNPSRYKNSPAWLAAQKMFYGTTNWVSGKFDFGRNVSDHFDFKYLPGRKYEIFQEAEGCLSMIPAVGTCLLGVFAGLLLRNQSVDDRRKVVYLLAFGIAGILLGWLWALQFPVIKKIWTSSFVLVAGGYSAILLAVFYLVVDVWKAQRWCQPFVWMGMNSITVYLTGNLIGEFIVPGGRVSGGSISAFLDQHVAKGFGGLVVALTGLFLAFLYVRFLYRRKIFLRF